MSNLYNKGRTPKKNLGSDTEETQGGYVKTGIKKGIPMLIDQAGYKIMDIFKYNTDLSNQGNRIFFRNGKLYIV